MKKLILIILSLALLSSSALLYAGQIEQNLKKKGLHVADLSEEDKINIQLNRLEQAIRQQGMGEIEQMLSSDYAEKEMQISKSTLKGKLESIFSTLSQARQFLTQTNPETGWKVTSTQDFSIRNTNIEIDGNKANVTCEIGLSSANKNYKGIKDTLTFVSENQTWFLSGAKNLFGLLEKASHAGMQELGTVNSSKEVLTQTRDDFTSTSLLFPVILGNYGKTTIPRFNKTESENWFGLNCMNSPYGIIADVEVSEGGSDFDHEYLFVTDVTSQKIIGTRQDNWVAEFGSQGSGQGQFWGPHGMCTLYGTLYFVADMFNNRIASYEFNNQLDEPAWDQDWYLNYPTFNHPVDVDAKDRNRHDGLDQTYIAIADEYNHQIVIFHEYPYTLGWDRNYGQPGSGEGEFMYPTSVCFGREPQQGWFTNDIYVTDYGNHRLVRFYILSDGTTIWRGSYQFPSDVELTSVDVDNKGLVYVVDRRHSKVYKFAPSQDSPYYFQLLGIWGEEGTADGQLDHPNTIQVAHGRYDPIINPDIWHPLSGLGDVFVTESWGDQTGVRRFVIGADVLNLTVDYKPYNESTGEGDSIFFGYHLTDCASVTEQIYRGAQVCTTYTPGTLNWGPQGGPRCSYSVRGLSHGTNYTVKITANSIYDPTIVVEKSMDVYVDTMTTNNPVIVRGLHCECLGDSGSCDNCTQCIKEYQNYTLEVNAYDPHSAPLSYKWSCGRGWLIYQENYYKQITIPESTICYQAPPAPTNLKDEDYELVSVRVMNSYGSSISSKSPSIHSGSTTCRCGDANNSQSVEVGDIVTLINYLYKGYPDSTIVDPTERADVNNSCSIEIGDIITLINRLYRGYPASAICCCWIH